LTPDIICCDSAFGGAAAIAAVGGSARSWRTSAGTGYEMVGKFNGKPLAVAACRACHRGGGHRGVPADRRAAGARRQSIERTRSPGRPDAHVVAVGAKGWSCSPRAGRQTTAVSADDSYSHGALALPHNGGYSAPWGRFEQWADPVQHDASDIDRLMRTRRLRPGQSLDMTGPMTHGGRLYTGTPCAWSLEGSTCTDGPFSQGAAAWRG